MLGTCFLKSLDADLRRDLTLCISNVLRYMFFYVFGCRLGPGRSLLYSIRSFGGCLEEMAQYFKSVSCLLCVCVTCLCDFSRLPDLPLAAVMPRLVLNAIFIFNPLLLLTFVVSHLCLLSCMTLMSLLLRTSPRSPSCRSHGTAGSQ